MKYIILADSDNVEPFKEPRQLTKINGETLVGRTIRLLKEKGIKEILITSHDKRFDNLGAKRYEPLYNDYKAKEQKGYWLSAFPIELLNEPVTFLLGDVYYSENAIKTIVETAPISTTFFCSSKKDWYSEKYIKKHDEPFGFKVINYDYFKRHIERVKRLYDDGLTNRHPIMWELYRSMNNIDVNRHLLIDNYVAINDETCDIDTEKDIIKLQYIVGRDDDMIRVRVIQPFSLKRFAELKEIIRANPMNDKEGELFIGDTFLCDKEMADYLLGANKLKKSFIEVIEVIPEEKKPVKKTTRKRKKKEE